jgi:ABC-type transport system involved in cytochrome c biogenesis ATPase subunit
MNTPHTSTTVLTVDDLHFSWPQGPLFQGLGFTLPPGVSQVVGDEGSGKTTLMRLLAGELAPDRGHLCLNGERLTPSASGTSAVFWIDPQTQAFDAISASRFLQDLDQRFPQVRRELLGNLIDGFGLQPHMDKPMYMLSTGSKRKVWLSAGIAAGAALTLIDHPFAALDAPSIRFLKELLQEAAAHHSRAWLLADYTVPDGVTLASTIEL